MSKINFENLSHEIKDIFYDYIKIKGYTSTKDEKLTEEFLINFFESIDYFQKNPDKYGLYNIEGDSLKRKVSWAMVKGEGSDTVVLIHHNDIVGIEDYKNFKPYAFNPEQLEKELFKYKDSLSDESKIDLESKKYIFGKGTADMKAGGAIQLSLIKEYSSLKNSKGNIILLSVPDEENLSSGMRAAVLLLDELRQKYNLKYKLMINSEPHQRLDENIGIISEGSVGKMMPFVYIRGSMSHAGKVFEGFNPTNLMSEIVRRTELNIELSDFINGESAPPPTWLYLKDRKYDYDVSMPLSIGGCFSVLTLNKEPQDLMEDIRKICVNSFNNVINEMNKRYKIFREKTDKEYKKLPWKTKVVTFDELYNEAYKNYKEEFTKNYNKEFENIKQKVINNEINMIEGNLELVDTIFQYINELSPKVVIGLSPPYYPNVSNIYFANIDEKIKNISNEIKKYVRDEFNQQYTREYFYTGISDLSYSSIKESKSIMISLAKNMPFYNEIYSIPVEKIEQNSMPCINIGPLGKDFHKLTERVLKEDLFYRTPRISNHAISIVLDW
ncbi:M20/M25/M40 family metallo-hydrolase [Clostridium sp. D2Q-11]|uniref:M20/M25/M40 family metallo-hydrolase n=1 Tax=Anaeromonas frigoriresistens TaxID=2683708 RepID=A0A942UWC9_9FIRM|nr:M20/M25/M40 family metallo-hydrolase [Anaeromonas frigoriresistens]MBS4538121.1 M20/M25/M40 family metallo-hydrolase [Anaeromonas frigoriresistens]